MRLVPVLLFCAFAALAGCTRRVEPPVQPPTLPPEATGMMPPQSNTPASPAEVLAEVNGTKITRGQAMLALQQAQQQGRRRMTLQDAVQMLIANTLILSEMDRLKIQPTEEELAAEREALTREAVPEGSTLEAFMQEKGISEQYLQRVLETKIRSRKFLAAKNEDVKVTDEEYEAFVAEHNAGSMSEEQRAEKKKELEGIRQQLVDGADFAKLAEEHSDCPSKARGGDLGTFPRGQMVPEFDKAAFSQATNEIGPIIETQFGYHIIQVLEKKADGEVKKDGVPVPEHVHARHILLMARKPAQPLPDKKIVMAKIEGDKANAAFGRIVRELMATATINYTGMEAPEPPSPMGARPPRPSVRPQPAAGTPPGPSKPVAERTVASQPVAVPEHPTTPPPPENAGDKAEPPNPEPAGEPEKPAAEAETE